MSGETLKVVEMALNSNENEIEDYIRIVRSYAFSLGFQLFQWVYIVLLFIHLDLWECSRFDVCCFVVMTLVDVFLENRPIEILLLQDGLLSVVLSIMCGTRTGAFFEMCLIYLLSVLFGFRIGDSVLFKSVVLVLLSLGYWVEVGGFYSPYLSEYTLNAIHSFNSIYFIIKFATVGLIHKYISTKGEQQLLEISSELEENRHEESKFMAMLSHFTKSALNGIVNYLFFIEKSDARLCNESSSTEAKTNHRVLRRCCDTILNNLQSVIDFVHVKINEQEESVMKRVNIRRLVNELYTIAKSSTRNDSKSKNRVKYDIEVSSEVPNYVIIDCHVFTKIFMNLATNSMKYCQKGTIKIKVDLVTGKDGTNYLHVQIKDTGIGIAPEKLESLFVPLKTISDHETLEVKPESFSLGLTIVKSMVERGNCNVDITSEGVGKGTTSEFQIPFFEAETPSDTTSEQSDYDMTEFEIPTVFVVDDNLINRRVVFHQLEMINNSTNVIECVDGKDCLKKFEEEKKKFDANKLNENEQFSPIILTDLDMPEMDGMELCSHFRNDESTEGLVIAAISGKLLNRQELIEIHEFDFVHDKPIKYKQMEVLFHRCLSLQKRRKEHDLDEKKREDLMKRLEKSSESNSSSSDFGDMIERREKALDVKYMDMLKYGLNLQLSVILCEIVSFVILSGASRWGMIKLFFGTLTYAVIDNITIFLIMVVLRLDSRVAKVTRFFLLFGYFIFELLFAPHRNSQYLGLIQIVNVIENLGMIDDFSVVVVGWSLWVCLGVYWEYLHFAYNYKVNWSTEMSGMFKHCEYSGILIFFYVLIDNTAKYVMNGKRRKKEWNDYVINLKRVEEAHQISISKISHDLIPPTSALLSFTEELLTTRKSSNEEMEKDLRISVRELDFAMRNFIICCKIRYNKVTTRNDQMCCVRTISKDLRQLINVMSLSNIEVNETSELGEFTEDTPFLIDRRKVMLVLGNLASNAAKHSRCTTIRIHYSIFRDFLSVCIVDDGKGIKNLDSKLEDCERLEHFLPKRINNAGMQFGLRVAKYLSCMCLEGGDLKISNCEEGGVKCSFQCAFEEVEEVEEETEGEHEEQEEKKKDVKDIKALILDDQIINAMFCCKHVKVYGVDQKNIKKTQFSSQAIEAMTEEKYDVFFCDFFLGGGETAIDVIRLIQENEMVIRPRYIVLCTGKTELRLGDSITKDYFDEFLGKPFYFSEIKRIMLNYGCSFQVVPRL